ncbi:methyl-accepting chemotaxis protein [Synergistaceae bacterium OttesenSCG-928-I11]|nr:methyl-accepting chemotaxis protein [Synergistaceae bacterium OttesenSCG-928-I11]
MRNISTMKKILILVAIMLALLGVVTFMGYRTAGMIVDASIDMYENAAKPAVWIADVKALAIQNRRYFGMAIGANDARMRNVENVTRANRDQIQKYFADYEKTIKADSAEEKRLYAEVTKARTDVNRLQDEVLAAAKGSDAAKKAEMIERLDTEGDITKAEGDYVALLDRHTNFMMKMADDINDAAASEARSAQWMVLIIAGIATILGVAFAILISRTITVPLARAQGTIGEFAQGDLTIHFDMKGTDEVAVMSKNLQDMSNVLVEVIGSVNEAGRNISETAHEFSAMAEETNASVEEFRSNVDEMAGNLDSLASASEEVNASVQEVAAGAQTTAEKGTDIARKVDDAMTAGDKGINAVRSVVQGIGRVAESSTAATGAIMQLGDRARQIQSFVSQIGGIADQTNLLALNAAIEAARAGEAGRGFAVVAEEVRKLAEDSNVAAKNIAELAGTITSEIDTIVSFAQENASDSNNAKDLSTQTEEEIKHMIDYLHDIANATQDLAAVAEEQAASSEEIAEAVQSMSSKINNTATAGENIRSSVGEVAAASERIAQGAEGLSSLSAELQERLSFFKMEEHDKGKKNRMRALPG